MNRKKYFYLFFYLLFLFALTGCGAKLTVSAKADQSADIDFSMDFGQKIMDTMEQVTQSIAAMDESYASMPSASQFFSADSVRESLKNSDLRNLKVSNKGKTDMALSGNLSSPKDQHYTAGKVKAANFLTCTSSSLTIILSPETVQALFDQLPEYERSCLDLLMAPVLTGEEMDKTDYLATIALVYGQDIADEMGKASVAVSLESPVGTKIKKTSLAKVAKSETSGRKVSFSIPFVDLLILMDAQTFSITW